MKVVMVTPYVGHDGIATYSRSLLMDPLSRRGVDCGLIASGLEPGQDTPSGDARVPVALGRVAWSPGALIGAVRQAKQWSPDVAHVQFAVATYGARCIPLIVLLAGLRSVARIPVVITFHEVTRDVERLGRPGRLLYRHLARQASVSIVHTRAAAELLTGLLGGRSGRVKLVDHPVREIRTGRDADGDDATAGHGGPVPPDAAVLRGRHGLGDRRILLAFGFIHVHKGLDVAVEALAKLRVTTPEVLRQVVLVVAGDVRRRSGVFRVFEFADRVHLRRVRRTVRRRRLDGHICFTGFVPASDVEGWFRTAEAVVLPYVRTEQSGVANLAIAYERPVIASDVGGLADLFHDAGLLCRPGDVGDLAAAIAKMVREDGLAQPGEHYRALLARAHPDRIAGQMSDIYADTLSGTGTR